MRASNGAVLVRMPVNELPSAATVISAVPVASDPLVLPENSTRVAACAAETVSARSKTRVRAADLSNVGSFGLRRFVYALSTARSNPGVPEKRASFPSIARKCTCAAAFASHFAGQVAHAALWRTLYCVQVLEGAHARNGFGNNDGVGD